ncbi:MAG: biopolymer transporter ExbD [Candidatus Methylacidiphilales bacterium]|nr:biopolymer transporter ExbD [Candidatus Methylacidiphilales bacterium]
MPAIPSPRHGRRPRLEIIPFIDIMFFLLATFMMVSLSMVKGEGIELLLPKARSAAALPDQPVTVTVSVDARGVLHWNREPVDRTVLSARLAGLKETAPDSTLIVEADYGCEFGRVVEVFDEARRLGLVKLIIRTEKAD